MRTGKIIHKEDNWYKRKLKWYNEFNGVSYAKYMSLGFERTKSKERGSQSEVGGEHLSYLSDLSISVR